MKESTLNVWKIAAVVLSIALGCAYVAYAQWNAAAERAKAAPPDADSPAPPPAPEPEVYFPSSKAAIGVPGATDRAPGTDKPPATPPPSEAEKRRLFGGSKSMPLEPPSGEPR